MLDNRTPPTPPGGITFPFVFDNYFSLCFFILDCSLKFRSEATPIISKSTRFRAYTK